MKPREGETTVLPILALLLSATVWGVMWYPLRLFEAKGLDGLWITFIFFAGATFGGGVVLVRHLRSLAQPWVVLGILLASGWCNTTFNLAMLEGNVMRALLLFYLSPLWATLIGWIFLGERLTPLSILLLAVSVAGAVIMLWQPGAMIPWPTGRADWLALGSGMAFAVLNALVRHGHRVTLPVKMMASWVGVLLVAGGWIVTAGVPLPAAEPATIGAAFLFGAVVIVIATLSVQYGVMHMPIHRSAVILLFELVAGAVSAQLLTEEVITLREWVGGGLIVAAALISARMALKRWSCTKNVAGSRMQ